MEAGGAEVFFEEVGPDFGQLLEVDVGAGPLFKILGDPHDFAHELVDAVVGLAEVEIRFAVRLGEGEFVAGVVEGSGGGEDGGGVGRRFGGCRRIGVHALCASHCARILAMMAA